MQVGEQWQESGRESPSMLQGESPNFDIGDGPSLLGIANSRNFRRKAVVCCFNPRCWDFQSVESSCVDGTQKN